MTSFILKIIAMITMLCDHVGDMIFGHVTGMNLIGRIAFPIFAFQISEGYTHTKNLKKYFLRLILFALISQMPFMLFLSIYTGGFSLNIFFTLSLGLLSILVYDKLQNCQISLFKNAHLNTYFKKGFAISIVILLGILAEICKFDYGFFGIAIIFLFYFFKNNKLAMVISYITACILKYGSNIILYGFSIWYILLGIFTALSIIFICLYNGKQGRKVKYLLYFFYPVHLLALYLLSYLLIS